MNMKKSILLIAIIFLAIIGSERAAADEDVYPFIWKNEYKYFVDPTFHTVKFCNDYKNVLCVSDSTIEILDATDGRSLRKKKYDFDNDLVEVSAKDNLIAICVKGGYWLNLIDFKTLEIKKSMKMDGRILDYKFFNNIRGKIVKPKVKIVPAHRSLSHPKKSLQISNKSKLRPQIQLLHFFSSPIGFSQKGQTRFDTRVFAKAFDGD
jgi:hypothetical protein